MSSHGSAISLSTDREFKLANAALQSDQVLLQLCFLCLESGDLALKFDVLSFLSCKVLLQFIVNSAHSETIAF